MIHDPKIIEIADAIEHCGDYGHFYVHKDRKEVYLCLGDADELDDSVIKSFEGLGYEVTVEAEHHPDDENFILISRGIEVYEDYETREMVKTPRHLRKSDLTARDKCFNTSHVENLFKAWLNEPYGVTSLRGEYFNDEQIAFARAAFEAGYRSE